MSPGGSRGSQQLCQGPRLPGEEEDPQTEAECKQILVVPLQSEADI